VLWTGDGVAGRAITGVGFQPVLVWVKARNNAQDHHLTDAVRGAGNRLRSNDTTAEYYNAEQLQSFDTDGFTVGTNNELNGNTYTYVAWSWKAGGAAVSNTDGSITSQVSANQDAGFSIVTYTGQSSNFTWGHGLGVAPSMVIIKRRNTAAGWSVYHSGMGATKRMQLDQDGGEETMSYFQNTEPTSTVFSVTTNGGVGGDGDTYVAYCFAEVEGHSKFGSYTGNSSTDGSFVYLGFKPAWLLVKRYNTTGSWFLMDAARNTYNVVNDFLYPNSDSLENSGSYSEAIDFLSNGFKCRTTSGFLNGSGDSYIFAAFAEAPTNNLFGGQANAR